MGRVLAVLTGLFEAALVIVSLVAVLLFFMLLVGVLLTVAVAPFLLLLRWLFV